MLLLMRIISVVPRTKVRRVVPVVALLMTCVLPSLAKVKGSGDFNGDGYADLCIGVPQYTIGTKTGAGGVNCLYGSASGLQATGSPAAQLWTRDTDGVQGHSEKNDGFGWSIAAGDFNGDGYDDICIGIPSEIVLGTNEYGAVNCLYGSAAGLQATGIGGPAPQHWDALNTGLNAGTSFGESLVAGDFNHDGYADLCIGIPNHTVSGYEQAGEVDCLYGSPSGLQAAGAQAWNRATPGIGGNPAVDEIFGQSVVAGDFNGDGFDDLCIGVPFDTPPTVSQGGVNCIYGSATGLQAKGGNGGVASQYWYPGVASLKGGLGDAPDEFGTALAVGDFNHDGYADLAIGSPQDFFVGDNVSTGKVNILYGSPTGLQDTGSGAPDDQLWSRDTSSVKGTSGPGWAFGNAMTAGDFNNDGYDDLCIGVPYASGHAANGGSINCLYGSVTGLQATGTGAPDDQLWDQDSPGVIGVTEENDAFGSALSAGDFNGDGFLDLAVGVPGENSGAGGINVLYGSATGLQSTGTGGPQDQFWRQGSNGVPGSGGGSFGYSLSH